MPRLTKFLAQPQDTLRTFETPFGRLTVFVADAAAVDRSLSRYGDPAKSELNFLRAMIGEGATVLDVGAYVGAHALAFSSFVGSVGRVIAIEFHLQAFEVLARNVEANGLSNVDVQNAPDEAASVDALGLADCALIKIDAEGAEDVVLRGAQGAISRHTPIIYAECGSLEGGLKTLAALKQLGYRALAHVVAAQEAHNGARELGLVGIVDAHLPRVERYERRPGEALLAVATADDLAAALFGPVCEAERGAVMDETQVLPRRLERAEAALTETQQLAHERFEELKHLRDKLDGVQGALAHMQGLAFDRAKEIEALYSRIDYDEKRSAERLAILEAMDVVTELDYPALPEFDESEPVRAATRDDVVQCYRRILRRDIAGDGAADAHLADAPSLRDLVRKLVQSVEPDADGATGPLAKRSVDRRDYLAANLTGQARRQCFLHHYEYLTETLSNAALGLLVRNGVTLFRSRPDEVEYSILMHNPFRGAYEGELSLFFLAGPDALFVLSFTIVPGAVVGLEDERVLLVARMQGQSRSPAAIRLAAKENSDVSPQAILFAALQGIARAIGVERIVGVKADNLVAYEPDKAQILENAYDSFYGSVGASGPHNGFYVWSASTPEKPLNQVKPGHRLRTKAKRGFKAMVAERVGLAWPVLLSPAYEFMRAYAVAPERAVFRTEIAVLRERVSAVRAELERFNEPSASARFNSVNRVLAGLVSRRARTLKLTGFATKRSAFERRLVKSGLFDESWYLSQYPDVAAAGGDPLEHYFAFGAAEGREPNAFFSTKHYLAENPDAVASGLNPLVHYCLYGAERKAIAAHRLRPAGQLTPAEPAERRPTETSA